MKLTPLNARKRKRFRGADGEPQLSPASEPGRAKLSAPSSGPKRPLLTKPSTRSSTTRITKYGREVIKRFSLIEQLLPAELMEEIFIYSGNLNFPRASPAIGRLLSSQSVLRRVIALAFQEAWIMQHPVKRPRGQERGCTFPLETMLHQPWVTVDLILDTQRRWQERNWSPEERGLWSVWYALYPNKTNKPSRSVTAADYCVLTECELHATPDYVSEELLAGQPGCESEQHLLTPAATFELALSVFRSHLRPRGPGVLAGADFSRLANHPRSRVQERYIHPMLPSSLLEGPWDERRFRLVFWDYYFNVVVCDNRDRWESTHRGFMVAIDGFCESTADNDGLVCLDVLVLYLRLGEARFWPEDQFDSAYVTAQWTLENLVLMALEV